MEVAILFFILLLFLSLPIGFVLKICLKAHDGNAISRFFENKRVRRFNFALGRLLFLLSLIGIVYNIYLSSSAVWFRKSEVFSPGMILILVYPLISLWLARLMQRAGKKGCKGV